MAQLFRHRVLRMLLDEEAIEESVVQNLLAWPHTGFGTHVSRAISVDEKTPGVVARYMVRPPITPERMLGEPDQNRIIYRSDAVHPRHQANFRVFEPVDFLAEVSAHLPDPHEKTTLFYGWYSNRTRGYRKQHGLCGNAGVADPGADAEAEGSQVPQEVRRSWARLIRQVYEVDPLLCSRCGGTMKIIAVIERPAVIQAILAHLGLPTTAPGLRGPPDALDSRVTEHPRDWSYEPIVDDLPFGDSVMA